MSSSRNGQFVWRELMTPDPTAAAAFYEALLGWGSIGMEMPGIGTYTMHTLPSGAAQGGYVAMGPDEADGHPPHWMPYVSVADLEATCARAKAHGGAVAVGPLAAGEHGRFAVLRDPQGAHFTAWTSAGGDDGAAPDMFESGVFCWEQLNTTDVAGATAFYGEVFGWKVAEFHGMTILRASDLEIAHVMEAPPGVPPHWLCHITVADLGASRARLVELGGAVHVEEIPIPTVGTIAVVADPHGAAFSLFEPAPRPA